MTYAKKNALFFFFVVLLGVLILWPYAVYSGHTDFSIQMITYINFVLLLTSVICIAEFFRQGESNRTPFHVFNIVFIILFYIFGLAFLVTHKGEYDGYSHLTTMDTIKKFILRWDVFSIMFWIILFAFIINVIYIMRHRESYINYS